MAETPVSLLERLRTRPDASSWRRLVDVYSPWITNYLRRRQFPASELDDLVQDVMTILVRELPNFQHEGRIGAFRRWLRGITLNRVRVFWRGRPRELVGQGDWESWLCDLEDPHSALSKQWDAEHNEYVVHRLLELLRGEFEPTTWQAFQMVTLEEKSTTIAAQALGMSTVAVRIAKSRVLSRFRQEIAGLID